MANDSMQHELIEIEVGQIPVVTAADANCTGVDTRDFANVDIEVTVGARGDTWDATNFIDIEVEGSDTSVSAGYADAANADLRGDTDTGGAANTGTIKSLDAAADGSQVYRTAYVGSCRWIRAVLNFSGTHSTGSIIGVNYIMGKPRRPPTNNP